MPSSTLQKIFSKRIIASFVIGTNFHSVEAWKDVPALWRKREFEHRKQNDLQRNVSGTWTIELTVN